MSGRALLTLHRKADMDTAMRWIAQAPVGTRVEFKGPQRSIEQNDKMWAMLTDVSRQQVHNGRKYTPGQWKVIFLHAIGREVQFIPSLDGRGFIPWGQSSSDLSKGEMSQLIEFITAWGIENGIAFADERNRHDDAGRAA